MLYNLEVDAKSSKYYSYAIKDSIRKGWIFMIVGVDPFILQLVIIPFIVIGLGLLGAFITKKITLGVIITLVANILLELILFEGGLSSWSIIFPVITLIILLFFAQWFKSQGKG